MRSRPRRITISLPEDVTRWAHLEAARQHTSVSRLLGRILQERMREQGEYERAMRRALARKPFLKAAGSCQSREKIHDRDLRT